MTALIRGLFRYPLFARELRERAARRRTYLARVIFGLVLYAVFASQVGRYVGQRFLSGVETEAFGFGHDLLRMLVDLLSWGLLLVQPALMAGSIAREKERDAFGLLLLTRLTPGKILLEKYAAGLFPTATLLLLALPLGAITMGYGGVSFQLLVASGMVLVATWLMVGAWSLFCSAWCRSSLGALLLAYLGGAAILFAPALLYSLLKRDVLFGSDLTAVEVPEWLWAFWPADVFANLLAHQSSTFAAAPLQRDTLALARHAALGCAPLFSAAALFLVLARVVLLPRAEGRPRERKAWLSRVAAWLLRGRRQLQPRHRDLPGDAPIAWRERSRSVLGSGTRFLYVSFLLWVATAGICLFIAGLHPPTSGPERLQKLGAFITCAAMLVLVATSVSTLLNEHTNGTLDILCTTPVGIDQLLREKAQAARRFWILFGVMLGIIFGVQGWSDFEYSRPGAFWRPLSQYWGTAFLALVVYPPLVIWVSLLVAARLKKRARAILAVLGLFALWGLAPLFILEFLDPRWRDDQSKLWWSLLSPLGILDANARDRLPWFAQMWVSVGRMRQMHGAPWVPVAVNFGFYALLGFLIRLVCLRKADAWLRR